jgi:glycerol-3-phosphate dehydrogenase
MQRNLQQLSEDQFDLLIIGAGIYGACIAWDATLRGLSVALIEKKDFGYATSANSLKIIHGGLRYLQQADIKRMRESISDRAALMRIAPHLIQPLPCLMPTYNHLLNGKEAMAAALFINDLISFDRNRGVNSDHFLPRSRTISRDECLKVLPGIDDKGLTGGAVWYDAQMYNSERLTLSFILSAAEAGASVANYAKAVGFLLEGNRITGVKVKDELTGNSLDIRARMVVNAAGPWINNLLGQLSDYHPMLSVSFAKAVNISVPQLFQNYAVGLYSRYNNRDVDAFYNKGGRLFFITPWRDQSIIGTTYKVYKGNPDDFEVSEEDVQELIDAFNSCYPPAQLTKEDVLYVYAGLVPISGINPKNGTVKRASRYQIIDHRQHNLQGLLSIMGVKYTTARDVAEKVIDMVFEIRGQKPPVSNSAQYPLYGGDVGDLNSYMKRVFNELPYRMEYENFKSLVYNYGTALQNVLHYLDKNSSGEVISVSEDDILRAEILYAVRHEMAQKLDDVVFRRTEIGTSGFPGLNCIQFMANTMGSEMGWGLTRIEQECMAVQEGFALAAKKGIHYA